MAAPVRPSLKTLIDRAIGDVSSRTQGSAYIKTAPERILAIVMAGLTHGAYGMLEYLSAQLSPVTCGEAMLLRWGSALKLPRNAATKAVRTATFTGVNTTVLPVDRALVAADGSAWTVTIGGTVSGGSVTVTAEAGDAGSDGNLEPGAKLSLLSPLAGITTDGVVAAVVTDGSDLEDIEDYRVRVLDDLRVPPSGGGPGDYVKWAKSISGVTRAWEFGGRMGYGTVSLAFVRDDDVSPIPDAGEIAEVQDYIDSVKPIDMRAAYVQAPVLLPVDMTIVPVPNTTAVKDAITAELTALFRDETDLEVSLPLSRIDEAISNADGETSHTITVISSLVPSTWQLLSLGSITWA
jgi:uncharacterized phage protein gp47/JayE